MFHSAARPRFLAALALATSFGIGACGGIATRDPYGDETRVGRNGTGGNGSITTGGSASDGGSGPSIGGSPAGGAFSTGGIASGGAPDVGTGGAAGAPNPDILWATQFGSTELEWLYAVDVDPNGNIYVAGATSGALPGFTNAGNQDIFVRKYDAARNEVWTLQFGSSGADVAYDMTVDDEGNVYLGGYTYAALAGHTNQGGMDAFVCKLSSDGTQLWLRQFGTSDADEVLSIAVDGAANVFVAGRTTGILPFQLSWGDMDAFVQRFDAWGNELWTHQFGTEGVDTASAITVDEDSNVYVTGNVNDAPVGQIGLTKVAYLRNYDISGVELSWQELQVGTMDAWAVRTGNGNVYVGGRTTANVANQPTDALVGEYGPLGDSHWLRHFGSLSDDAVSALSVDDAGYIYAAGKTKGALPGFTNAGGGDAFVRKFDSASNAPRTWQFGTEGEDTVTSVSAGSNGTVFVAGHTSGLFAGKKRLGKTDAFVVELAR